MHSGWYQQEPTSEAEGDRKPFDVASSHLVADSETIRRKELSRNESIQ